MSETMSICGREYPIVGHISVPIIDIPMMSDEEWMEMVKRHAEKEWLKEFGHLPENISVAIQWQRRRDEERLARCKQEKKGVYSASAY